MILKGLKRILSKNYIAINVWRVVLLYILLSLLRVVFYAYNADVIGALTMADVKMIVRSAFSFDSASIVYANAIWAIFTFLPIRSRAKRWYRKGLFWLYMAMNSAGIIFINLCDTVYFRYTSKRFTSDELSFDDNGNNLKLALSFATENWHLAILVVVLCFVLAKLYFADVEAQDPPRRGCYFYPINSMVLLMTMVMCVAGLRGGFSFRRPQNVTDAMINTSDSNIGYTLLSNPFCMLRTLGKAPVVVPHYFDEERLNELYTPYHYPTAESTSKARYKGYNVMIFLLESFSAENSAYLAPDLYEEGESGYMPFVDSLMREGLTFRKMFANGGQSICATPAVIGSLPSLERPLVVMPQYFGKSYQMPAMLKDLGYSTTFFCGSNYNSMGFVAYTQSAGIDRYVAREEYESQFGDGDFDGFWGIFDRPFIDHAGHELTHNTREPFFAAQFTISSHHPFPVERGFEQILPKGKTSVQPIIAYTDSALRDFFTKYRKEAWFDRTIFVLIADHVSPERMAEKTRSYPMDKHIPAVIYTTDGALKGEIEDVAQQADIMPTILGLLGYDRPYFAYGRDVLGESERPKWSVAFIGKTSAYDNSGKMLDCSNSDTLKAYEQQFYKHLDMGQFVVPEQR